MKLTSEEVEKLWLSGADKLSALEKLDSSQWNTFLRETFANAVAEYVENKMLSNSGLWRVK